MYGKPWNTLFASILWNIWKACKQKVFNGGAEETQQIIRVNSFEIEDYHQAFKQVIIKTFINRALINWIPPDVGGMKINTDGSNRVNPSKAGQAGCGGLIRNEKENWVK